MLQVYNTNTNTNDYYYDVDGHPLVVQSCLNYLRKKLQSNTMLEYVIMKRRFNYPAVLVKDNIEKEMQVFVRLKHSKTL